MNRRQLSLTIILLFSFLFAVMAQDDSPCPAPENKKAQKLFTKASDHFQHYEYGDAYGLLKQVIEEEPEYTDAYYLMGMINIKRSTPNIAAAERNFLKVIELCKDYNAYVYYYLGDISFGAQKFPQAKEYLEIFLKDVDKIKNDKDYDRAVELLKFASFYANMLKKSIPFNPLPVPGLCTGQDEYLPIISPDNDLALFTRVVKMPPDKNDLIPKEKMNEVFMYSVRKDGFFDTGEEMPFPFNQFDNEGGATLTIDNKKLFYTVCKYGKGSYFNCDIHTSGFNGDSWSEITAINNAVNLPDSWESQPSISPDGKTLYFVSDRKGGLGGYDIYQSVQNEKGEWMPASNLGPLINTAGNEKSPFIHSDNTTFYFSSDGHLGMGKYDIFFTKRQENGQFSKPVNIGYPINTPEDEVGFFASTDGHYGYFASNKYQGRGGWDIFYFDLYPEARPEKVLFVKGELKNEETKEAVRAKIELKNVETKKVTEIPVDSITGEYAAVVLFRNDYMLTVKKEGFGYESKYISTEDSVFKIPAKVNLEIKPIEVGKAYKLNDIYFETASFDLTPGSKRVLDGFIQFLKDNPEIKIAIQGYTDNVGDDKSNQLLSENRAHSVYQYIVDNGIAQQRLTFAGFGESLPIASNLTAEGRAKNRRTVFVITGK